MVIYLLYQIAMFKVLTKQIRLFVNKFYCLGLTEGFCLY